MLSSGSPPSQWQKKEKIDCRAKTKTKLGVCACMCVCVCNVHTHLGACDSNARLSLSLSLSLSSLSLSIHIYIYNMRTHLCASDSNARVSVAKSKKRGLLPIQKLFHHNLVASIAEHLRMRYQSTNEVCISQLIRHYSTGLGLTLLVYEALSYLPNTCE